jgi:hypothetical protein
VAEAQGSSSKNGLTRGKAILIAVLGIVLLGILYMQFGRHETSAASNPAAYRPPRPPGARKLGTLSGNTANLATAAAPESSAATAQVIDESRWTSPQLAKVVAYDPFKLPEAFPHRVRDVAGSKGQIKGDLAAISEAEKAKKAAEALGKIHLQLKELKEHGVSMIVGEGNQYAAMIDDRIVHVGDKINGFTVVEIDDQDGTVVIEKKDSP